MLLILPSSEGKRVPTTGTPLLPSALAFPDLAPLRATLMAAVAAASGRTDARTRFGLSEALAPLLVHNQTLTSAPTAAALDLYQGVVYAALDAASLSADERREVNQRAVIMSALYGLVRPADQIPPYRLSITTHLLEIPTLATFWRAALSTTLDEVAGDELVIDLRAGSYAAAGAPSRAAERVVRLRLAAGVTGGNVALKQLRGAVARELLTTPQPPRSPEELLRLIGAQWPAELRPAATYGAPLELHCGPRYAPTATDTPNRS